MKDFDIEYKDFGDQGILIQWSPIISQEVLADVLAFQQTIKDGFENVFIVQSYHALLVKNIPCTQETVELLKKMYSTRKPIKEQHKVVTIPVCYEERFAIDITELSLKTGLDKEEIIHLHSSMEYLVYFIGFLPGFLYLGGLDERLHCPRRSRPRMRIRKGDVGVAGSQTGIYPTDSPGGWNIIGNSPVSFFDVRKSRPTIAESGDRIRFYRISREEHNHLLQKTP